VLTAAASLEAGSQNLGQRIGKSSWLSAYPLDDKRRSRKPLRN
jgi:hypothetical protein